jgi:uncharacterized protein (DUF924 family)
MSGEATSMIVDQHEVLRFWLGELDAQGRATRAQSSLWWRKDAAFDARVSERFFSLHEALMRGEHRDWLQTPRGSLATIVVLDQFSRNIFRDSPRMFASDPLALRIALTGIERGQDRELALDERFFFYMPLMHCEVLVVQERCVSLFGALARDAPEPLQPQLKESVVYAERHRDIVRRFGRFPHRNLLLGRTSTAEEIEFLTQPGSSF